VSRIWQPSEIMRVLGISQPEEINIWSIAELCGAKIRQKPLRGCAANLVGYDGQAIITVDERSPAARQRFSIAHELGHWQLHRGQTLFQCNADQLMKPLTKEVDPEREANSFATELLMPQSMCLDLMLEPVPTFELAMALASRFRVSLVAMSLRLVELSPKPAVLYLADGEHQIWYRPNRSVPGFVRLPKTLSPQILHCQDYCRRTPACKSQWLQGSKKSFSQGVHLWQESYSRGSHRLFILTFEGIE
jgi:Zn-dependent peptidase ImmA (M78 family)